MRGDVEPDERDTELTDTAPIYDADFRILNSPTPATDPPEDWDLPVGTAEDWKDFNLDDLDEGQPFTDGRTKDKHRRSDYS
jgi:hypothetical protein